MKCNVKVTRWVLVYRAILQHQCHLCNHYHSRALLSACWTSQVGMENDRMPRAHCVTRHNSVMAVSSGWAATRSPCESPTVGKPTLQSCWSIWADGSQEVRQVAHYTSDLMTQITNTCTKVRLVGQRLGFSPSVKGTLPRKSTWALNVQFSKKTTMVPFRPDIIDS